MLIKFRTKRKRPVENNDINFFGKRVEEEIKKRGLTNAHVARKGEISQSSITDVISGRRQAGVRLIKGIAKGLDLPVEEVARWARILPTPKGLNKEIEELVHQAEKLPPEEQRKLVEMVKALNRLFGTKKGKS